MEFYAEQKFKNSLYFNRYNHVSTCALGYTSKYALYFTEDLLVRGAYKCFGPHFTYVTKLFSIYGYIYFRDAPRKVLYQHSLVYYQIYLNLYKSFVSKILDVDQRAMFDAKIF